MKLKFSDKARPLKVIPEVQRREKLINRIDQQIGFVRQMIEGNRPRASWVWMDETGTYFLPIKYGKQTLELQKGMGSIECQNLDEIEHALCEVRAMTLLGKLDEKLAAAASDIRRRFKASIHSE
ncbi:MAG: hypothetical protein K2Y17_09855 [Qipengyuania sp.]|nr:hypothetical protein [Qipengyuania sp.]